jgi:hypothetical protein
MPPALMIRIVAACALLVLAGGAARADEWRPPGLQPSRAVLADVVAAARTNAPPLEQRFEHWTYVNGSHVIPVSVAVRDDDFRTSLVLDGLTYTAGRLDGVRWRSDGNGIAHGVLGDMQGDAADAAPQALFPIDWQACTLAGEARLPAAAWVLETHRDDEKPAFLYVDETTHAIVREVFRDGRRIVTTTFDRFEPLAGRLRARHWHIDDGVPAYAIDATADRIEAGAVSAADVAIPPRPAVAPPATTLTLPAHFRGGRVSVDVRMNGNAVKPFILDTGTASITIDPRLSARDGILEHAAIAHLDAGGISLEHVSTLTIPFWEDGILGYDFFFGHVIEIGYRSSVVRVLSANEARDVFADPKTLVIPISVDLGLPLAGAAIGPAASGAFALDTGSPQLYVMRPFVERFASEIAQHWTPAGPPFVVRYLEGGVEIQPYRVASVKFGGLNIVDAIVGAQIPTKQTDDLLVPFDAIIGTDILAQYDLYFDYDNGRLGLRR